MSQCGKVHNIDNIISFSNILKIHKKYENTLVLCFSAKWCGPCTLLLPKLEECAVKYPSIIFLKIDISLFESIASEYNITSIPTIVIQRINTPSKRLVGATMKEIEAELQKEIK